MQYTLYLPGINTINDVTSCMYIHYMYLMVSYNSSFLSEVCIRYKSIVNFHSISDIKNNYMGKITLNKPCVRIGMPIMIKPLLL